MDSMSRRAILGLGAAQTLALCGIAPASALAAGWGAPASPPDLPHGPEGDLRAWAAATSANNPADKAQRAAFVKRKVLTAFTNPSASKEKRVLAAQETAQSLGVQLQDVLDQPTPGGVGMGLIFTDDYRIAWGQGTSLRYDIVCPLLPGGNVSTWLYLTATNRSKMGVEALVAYHAQDEARLFIWDWALQTPGFVVDIPLSSLQAYIQSSQGANAQRTLSIWNSTYSIGGLYYRNAVYLYNRLRESWDLVYLNDYSANDAGQKPLGSGVGGWWGPIVETFQPVYSGTNPMGFKRTSFSHADTFGRWSDWALLKPDQSFVREDNAGFEIRDMNPNFGFVVIS
jgi:hypothetical protein